MTILIGKYEFDGPYKSSADLEEREGLYAILRLKGKEYELVYMAQADNIREHIEVSQAVNSPNDNNVLLAACYTSKGIRERRTMLEEIQREFDDQDNQECDNRLPSKTVS